MGAGRLVFDGDIELLDATPSAEDGYWFEAIEGLEFGQPVPITVILTSLLRDGALVSKTGDDNREVAIPFRVCATNLLTLADGEARVSRALGKRTTLEWTPPDGFGPMTVFDVMTSDLDNPPHDDLAELRNQRSYTLRLTCLPFGRSAEKVIDDAGTPPSSGTVFLNCESTTGWSKWTSTLGEQDGPIGTDIAVDTTIFAEGAGSIRAHAQNGMRQSNGFGLFTNNDRVSGLSLDTGGGGYLSIRVRWSFQESLESGLHRLWVTPATGAEFEVTNYMSVNRDANGFVRYVWQAAPGLTITGLRFQVSQISQQGLYPSQTPYVWYDDFEFSAAATSEHLIVKQHYVQGSARTTGSLHIASPEDAVALGQVLAATMPTNAMPPGFQLDGARWVSAGSTTVDSTALHGAYYTPDPAAYSSAATRPVFDPPVGMLTAGPYVMVSLVKASTSTLTTGVQAQLLVGSTLTGPTSAAEVTLTNVATGWQFVTIGTVYLPPLPVQNAATTTKVRLLFKGAPLSDIFMIPAWQVGGKSVAEFSIVNCGTGTPSAGGSSSHLWIDSPSADQPQGGWWRGPTGDRANAQSAWPDAKKPGLHTFEPGSLTNFVVATGAAGPTSTLEYFPAWRTNAAL